MKTKAVLFAIILAGPAWAQGAFAQMNATLHTPAQNALNVPADTNIVVTFDAAVGGATVDTDSFNVDGSQTGHHTASFTGGGTNIVTCDPIADFKPGEVVTVTLTTAIQSTGAVPLAADYTWRFTVASGEGPRVFSAAIPITATADCPQSVYAADMDGDGDMDVLHGNVSDDTVAWHENNGIGNFTEHIITNTANLVVAVFAADVDGDGDMDALSGRTSDNTLAWHENDGAQSFTEHVVVFDPTATYEDVFVADMDGDGDMDVLSSSEFVDRVAWYENDGAQNFTQHNISATADGARSVYAADVDGDGDTDVLSANRNEGTILWFENDGAQNFTEHVIDNAAFDAFSVYAADVDGDGDTDALSATRGDTISWYENDGARNFTEHIIGPAPAFVYQVCAADVDGDGDIDVFHAASSGNQARWYENDGSQNFTARNITATGNSIRDVVMADVDGDGDMDALSVDCADDTVAWYEQTAPPPSVVSTSPAVNAANAPANTDITVQFSGPVRTASIANTTFNVDGSQTGSHNCVFTGGDTDTITCNPDADFKPGEVVTVTLTTGIQRIGAIPMAADYTWQFTVAAAPGPGTFPVRRAITTAADGARNVYAADMDGDGDMDILSASENDDRIAWYENDGAQNFTPYDISTAADDARDVHAADVDGDGDMDVLSASELDDRIAWYENNGAQSFTPHDITVAADGAFSVHAADVDGDGDMDVLSASYSDNRIAWYENDGSQNFTTHDITAAATGAESVYAADVDGDGDMDVLSATYDGDTVTWYENDGSQNFTTHDISVTADGGRYVHAADVDGDGDMDVLSASRIGSMVDWHENDGAQNFTLRNISATDTIAEIAHAADVDGDGDMDVLSASFANNTVSWHENDGAQNFSPHTVTGLANRVMGACVADVDGDGDLDILSASRDDDTIAWYEQTLPLAIVSETPAANSPNIAANSDIVVQFSDIIDGATATGATININASQTGSRSAAFTGGGTDTVTCNPDADFKPGEVVTVTLTTGIQSASGVPLENDFTWQFTVASAAGSRQFPFVNTITTSADGATSVYAADVDGDGDMDMLSSSFLGDTIAWHENDGAQNFTPYTITAAADGAWDVFSADMDGDGDLDVLSASANDNTIAWYENDGAQNFTMHDITTAASFPQSVYAADVDGDGDMDVLAALAFDDTVAWYENDGAQNFTMRTVTTTADYALSVIAADMDRDGDTDILAASSYDDTVAWYENDGLENFTFRPVTVGADGVYGVFAKDMDGDGDMDVLSASINDDTISWHENDGAQNFTAHVITAAAAGAIDVFAADVDGDGDMDVLAASEGDDTVVWHENDGAQNFTAHVITTSADSVRRVFVADVDGDGDLDILSASANDDTVAWYEHAMPLTVISNTPGAYAPNIAANTDITVQFSEAVDGATITDATFNVDSSQTGRHSCVFTGGGTDTITCNPDVDFMPGEVVTVTLATGIESIGGVTLAGEYTWHFTVASAPGPGAFPNTRPITTTANAPIAVYAADMDGDGDMDALAAIDGDDTIAWYENDGAQSFTSHVVTGTALRAWDVHAADVDGDGDMDALSASRNDDTIAWYENDGFENFTPHVIAATAGNARSVFAADVDGDGDTDVLSASRADDTIAWYENDGAQNFTTHVITNTALNALDVYAADVDGDGDMDVLSASSGDDTIAWYENDGEQNFTTHTITALANGARGVFAADVNGDGFMDVLSASNNDDTIAWYENDGAQNFTFNAVTTTAVAPYKVSAADVDGDGDMDVLSTSSNDDTVAWYENDGLQNFTAHPVTTVAARVRGLSFADMDGDGDLDVLAASENGNTIAWYEQTADYDGDLAAAGVVVEPVNLPSTADTAPEAVDVFDFTLTDGGTADGLPTGVTQITLHTSGTGDFSRVAWRLNGTDAANVTGVYDGLANTITFPGLAVSVADGMSEVYTVNAYFSDNTGLIENQVYILGVDGDTDLVTDPAGTQMGATLPVNNGTGSPAVITGTHIFFATQPADTQVEAVMGTFTLNVTDAFGNVDADGVSSISLSFGSNPGGGAISGTTSVNALAGAAAFGDISVDAPGTGYTFIASSAFLVPATSSAFNILPGPLNRFTVESAGGGPIGEQTAGVPFAIRVTAYDALNNVKTDFAGNAAISSSGILGAGGGTTANFAVGVLDSHSVTISNVGTFDITAANGGATGVSNVFDVISGLPPGFTASAPSGDTREDGTQASFTVRLDIQPSGNVSIGVASLDTAEGTVGPPNLVFTDTNWNVPQTVTVTGVDDAVADGNRTYAVRLSVNPGGTTDSGYAALSPRDVSMTNIDNDSPGVSAGAISGDTGEDGTPATFTIRLDSQPSGNVAIDIVSLDTGEAYVAPSNAVFTDINWDAPQTVTVTGVDDDISDGDRAYAVRLSINAGGTADTTGYAALSPYDVSMTNIDNDTPGATVGTISGNTGEDGTRAAFTVRLNTEPTAPVVVDVASSDATEGLPAPALLTFTPADWNADRTVTVTGVDDGESDGDRAYTVLLTINIGSTMDTDYASVDPPDVAVVNIDDDSPGFAIGPVSGNTGEDGTRAAFPIRLNSEPDGNVVVNVASSDETEGSMTPSVLIFTPANWDADQTVTATGIDDVYADGNREYKAILAIDTGATADTTGYATLDPPDVSIINIDNETAGFTIGPIVGDTAEDGTTAFFTLKLNSAPDGRVAINATSADDSEGTVVTGTLTFTGADWDVWQTVTVAGVDDDLADGNQRYTVFLAVNTGGTTDAAYAVLDPPDVALTNIDDETAGFAVSPMNGDTAENGTQAEFSIRLNSEPDGNVAIAIASSDPGEGVASPSTLTFTPLNWKTEHTITVTGVDDGEADGNQNYVIILTIDIEGTDAETYASVDPPDIEAVNIDDDAEDPAPIIVGQSELSTEMETALTFSFEHLIVNDSDSDYPADFTLVAESGANYTIRASGSEATIQPVAGFAGTLSVPVRVNDGEYDSNVFQLEITVTAADAEGQIPDPGLDISGAGIPFELDVGPSALCLNCDMDANKIYKGVSLAMENTNPVDGDFLMIDNDSDGDGNPETGIYLDEGNIVWFDGERIGSLEEDGEDGDLEIAFDSEHANGAAVGALLGAVYFGTATYPPDERPRDLVVSFGGGEPDAVEYGMTVNFIDDRLCACHFEENEVGNTWPAAVSPENESVVPDGASVKLAASPWPASEAGEYRRTHWLVRRKDRQNPDHYESSSVDLTEHTVTGLEAGSKYVWKAGYENSDGEISWSRDSVFKIGRTVPGEQIRVAPGVSAENFRMVSFPQWPDDPTFTATLDAIMGPELDRENYRVAAFDQARSCFTEYGCERFEVEPGRAYWFLARTGLDISVTGVPVSLNSDFELEMRFNPYDESGWNMIGPPNDADYYWGDIRVVVYEDGADPARRTSRSGAFTITEKTIVFGPTPLSEMTFPNDIIDHRLWRLEGEDYFPDTTRLEKNKGYLARVKRRGVSLVFPAGAGVTSDSEQPPDPGHDMTEPDDDVTPAFPFPTAVDGSCPEVESGEPGCFVRSAGGY